MMYLLCSDAFDVNFGVVIFHLRAGFDATEKKDDTGGTLYYIRTCLFTCTVHVFLLYLNITSVLCT